MPSFRQAVQCLILIAMLFVLAPSVFAQNRGTFEGSLNYPAGAPAVASNTGFLIGGVSPTEVHTGDFNGDGKLDIVAVATCSLATNGSYGVPTCPVSGSAIAVYLANGDGTFQPPILNGGVPQSVRSIVVGDFNGDGKLDVAAASDCNPVDCTSGAITLLTGNGDGTFTFSAQYTLNGVIGQAGTLAVGDFNHDGKLDVVAGIECYNPAVTACSAGALAIYPGNGDGTLGTPSLYFTVGNNAPIYPVVGDFNGDGIDDVAYISGSNASLNTIVVLFGGGSNQTASTAVAVSNVTAIVAADVNGDGKADLEIVSLAGTTAVSVLVGNGDGTFQNPVTTTLSLINYATGIAAKDLNGNGKPDLVVSGTFSGSTVNGVQVLLNDGSGSFLVGQAYPLGGWQVAPIVVADFNGDGKADVVMASGCSESVIPGNHCPDGSLDVLLGNGDGTFQGPVIVSSPFGGPGLYSAGVADFNGDGVPDLFDSEACVAGPPTVCGTAVFLGKGDGTYQTPALAASGAQEALFSLSADFNRDGKPDLAILNACDSPTTCASPSVSVLLGNGDGTFQPPVTYQVGGTTSVGIVMGDFNGDGNLDIAVATQCDTSSCTQGMVSILLGNKDGTFQNAVTTGVGAGSLAISIATGDFNNDRLSDIVVGSSGNVPYAGFVTILLSNGDGTLRATGTYSSGGGATYYANVAGRSVATGDLNHDGMTDVIVTNFCESSSGFDVGCSNGSFGVLLGNGDGTFQPTQAVVVTDGNLLSANLSDVDVDGNLDLIASTTGGVMVARGKGDGTFYPPVIYGGLAEGTSKVLAVADLNNDGAPDMIQPDAGGNLAIFYNRGGTVLTSQATPNPATEGQSVTFTATLAGTVVKNLTPSGTVTFFDNGKPFMASLNAGTASVILPGDSRGTHVITPYYSGDANFNPRYGAAFELVVNPSNLPSVGFSAKQLAFGNQALATTSATQSFMVINGGTGSLAISGISITGTNSVDFAETNNCGSGIPAGGNCSISVTFTPSVLSSETAYVSVADNANGSPQTLSLSGTGTAAAPSTTSVTLSKNSLVFSDQGVGVASNSGQKYISPGPGANAIASVSADFNGDGKLDVAVANGSSNTVSVLLDNGDGTFQTPVVYAVGNFPNAIVAADFNKDGKLDLAVADQNSGDVAVLLGNGDGTFQVPVVYPGVPTPLTLNVADFNGDGFPDLVAGYQSGTILLNQGNGTFVKATGTGIAGGALTMAVGDFNGDGRKDIAVGGNLYLNNGDGTFTNLPLSFGGIGVASGDLNGDGKLDLVFFTRQAPPNNLGVALGNGDGTFQPPVYYSIDSFAFSIVVADINGDGKPDVVTAHDVSGSFDVLLGNGDGTLTNAVSYESPEFGTQSLSLGDFNGDGKVDIVIPGGSVAFIPGNGDGTFRESLNVFVRNTGSVDLNVSGVTIIGADASSFHLGTNTCTGFPWSPGESCRISVRFQPTSLGPKSAQLQITDNTNDSPQIVTLSGSGVAPIATLSVSSVDFGSQLLATTCAPNNILLSNSGTVPLNISTIAVSGANAGDFGQSNTCGTSVAAGANCSLAVTFAPSAAGPRSATITITDDATGSPQTISLSGNGVVAITTTSLISSVNPSVFSQKVSLTVTVTSASGTPTGTVSFYDGSTVIGTATLSSGTGSISTLFALVGSHSITASYGGDAGHGVSTSFALIQTVNKATTTTSVLSSRNPQLVAQTITLTAVVTSQFGASATGSVVFKSGATTLGTVVLSGNQASVNTSFATAGTRSITAQYAGDTNNSGSISTVLSQSVVTKFATTTTLASSLNPSYIGQAVTLTATVSSLGGTPPDGEVITFKQGATVLGTSPLSGGKASFTTSTLTVATHTIAASYAADATFNASTSAGLAQVVKKYPTSTVLSSTLNPSIYGQSVTLNATVSSAGPSLATGTVTFKNGATTLGTVTISSGSASLTRTNLAAGTLSITATYNGDGSSAVSTSAPISQIVNLATTTTTVVSSRNPSAFGQSVKFTATVTSGTSTPTGTVTFSSGATVLGTVTLAGGKASLTTTTLPRGTNTITATYNGTANITGSSGTVFQLVN